jgi:hypothetical protein
VVELKLDARAWVHPGAAALGRHTEEHDLLLGLRRRGPERERHAVVAVVVLPTVVHVPMVVVVAHHVVVDPVASHVMPVLVEVHRVSVHIDHPTADVKGVLRIVPQWVVGGEGQDMVLLRPFPISGDLVSIEPTRVERAEPLHSVLHLVLKLQPDAGVRVYAGAVTAR